jgi:hypothetical protein
MFKKGPLVETAEPLILSLLYPPAAIVSVVSDFSLQEPAEKYICLIL